MICPNLVRFNTFCRQQNLNPRARLLKPVTRAIDSYKLQGHLDFDVVYITDWSWIRDIDDILDAIHVRISHPKWNGNIYHIAT